MVCSRRFASFLILAFVLFTIVPVAAIGVEDSGWSASTTNGGPLMTTTFMTYLGGNGEDWLRDVCFDDMGNFWVLGYAESTDLALMEPVQESYAGAGDGVVARFSHDYELEFCTYFGGDGTDFAMAIELDSEGNAVVVGTTDSTDFPVLNALQPALNGTDDGFISKFAPNGTLLFSSYFGGSGDDGIEALVIDAMDNCLLGGFSTSTDLPVTAGVVQESYGGGTRDMMLASIAEDGQSVGWCSYLGGDSDETIIGMALGDAGNLHVVGLAEDNDTVTEGAYQEMYGGGQTDTIVAKLTPMCDEILWTTLLGGNALEFGYAVGFDSDNNVIVSGYTASTDFPVLNELMGNTGGYDNFLTRLSQDGSELISSTYLGGDLEDRHYGMQCLSDDSVAILCTTYSDDVPVAHALQAENAGSRDAHLSILDSENNLVFGTYLGGSSADYGMGMEVYQDTTIAFTGYTSSSDLPVVEPTQSVLGEDTDGYVCILKRNTTQTGFPIPYVALGVGATVLVVALVLILRRR